MFVLAWLARFVGAVIVLLLNVALAGGLFLLSAYLFAQADADAAIPGYVLRIVAACWLWIAAWRFVRHGVLQRPAPAPARKGEKASAREVAVSSAGCLASLVVVAGIVLVVGPFADWVYDGLVNGSGAHPVQVSLQRAVDDAFTIAAQPERAFVFFVAVVLVLLVLRAVSGRSEHASAGRTPRRSRRREAAAVRSPAAPPEVQRMASDHARHPTDARHAQAPHRTAPSSAPRTSRSGRTIDDPMLGVLQRDDAAGGWRLVNPRSQVGALFIRAEGEPTREQMELARTVVQRSFEVLLRASEGARPAAQANGIGLPRFTLHDSTIHEPKGSRPPAVVVRLQCEGDTKRTYDVTSTDGMDTFEA